MNYENYERSFIEKYLESHSRLDSFYVFCLDGTNPGLIHYFDEQGQSWSLMEDDDLLVNDCLQYLKENGSPLFEDVEEMKRFEAGKKGS